MMLISRSIFSRTRMHPGYKNLHRAFFDFEIDFRFCLNLENINRSTLLCGYHLRRINEKAERNQKKLRQGCRVQLKLRGCATCVICSAQYQQGTYLHYSSSQTIWKIAPITGSQRAERIIIAACKNAVLFAMSTME